MSAKKVALGILLLMIGTQLSFAQTEKGKFLIGANSNMQFSALSTKVNDSKVHSQNSFSLSPQLGYFVATNFVVGFEVPVSYQSSENKSYFPTKNTATTVTFTPFARYYINASKIVKPYVQGQVGLGQAVDKQTSYNNYYGPNQYYNITTNSSKYNLFVYGVSGGLAVFLNDKISLDLGIGYSSVALKSDNTYYYNYTSEKQTTSGLTSSIGFSLFF